MCFFRSSSPPDSKVRGGEGGKIAKQTRFLERQTISIYTYMNVSKYVDIDIYICVNDLNYLFLLNTYFTYGFIFDKQSIGSKKN